MMAVIAQVVFLLMSAVLIVLVLDAIADRFR